MIEIDPITQCEIRRPSSLLLKMALYAAPYMDIAQSIGMFTFPKSNKKNGPSWKTVNLSKEERKLSPEDRDELRRYRWTLERMYKEK